MNSYADLMEERKGVDLDVDMTGIHEGEDDSQEEQPKTQTVTGTVADIRTAVKGGESYYYVKLEQGAPYYAIKAADAEAVVILNVGDTVTVTISADAKGDIISASAIAKGAPAEENSAA